MDHGGSLDHFTSESQISPSVWHITWIFDNGAEGALQQLRITHISDTLFRTSNPLAVGDR